jgi:hypothetical protein
VEISATAGLDKFIQFMFVLLSLPWWLQYKASIPPDEIMGAAPTGEIAWIT